MASKEMDALVEQQRAHALDEPEGQLCPGGTTVVPTRKLKVANG
ncbi:hypothetical protein [Microbispora sp. H13382]|nr:hypothetical protein [Microbispora sp. H13382]